MAMDKYGYDGPESFRPLSPWAYFGYALLFSLPIAGFIVLIVLSFNDTNINRRNFARSYFISLLLVVVLIVILMISGIGLAALGNSYRYY